MAIPLCHNSATARCRRGHRGCAVAICDNRVDSRIGRTAMDTSTVPSREQLLHALYEAAELEHNSDVHVPVRGIQPAHGQDEGLEPAEAAAVARWRADDRSTSRSRRWATSPPCGTSRRRSAARRASAAATFRSTPACLPAGVVVKLAPFNDAVLAALHLSGAARRLDGARRRGFATEFAIHVAAATAAPHADGHRLRHRRHFLCDAAARVCGPSSSVAARPRRSAAIRRCRLSTRGVST